MTRKEITEYMIDGLLHVVEYLRQTHPDTTKTARRENHDDHPTVGASRCNDTLKLSLSTD